MESVKKVADTVSAVGMGQSPIELSHPIHPATVHWPISFLTASFTLDTLQHFTPGIFPAASSTAAATSSRSIISRIVPPASMISGASFYLGGAGIAFSLVSIATGLSELYGMTKAQAEKKGSWTKAIKDAYAGDKNDLGATKLKTTLTHASLNDITVGIASYNFYKRGTSPTMALPKSGAYLAAAVLPLFLYSAYLGAALVYEMGVGVMRQGEGAEWKKMQEQNKVK